MALSRADRLQQQPNPLFAAFARRLTSLMERGGTQWSIVGAVGIALGTYTLGVTFTLSAP